MIEVAAEVYHVEKRCEVCWEVSAIGMVEVEGEELIFHFYCLEHVPEQLLETLARG